MEARHRSILRRHKSILEKDLEPKGVLSELTTVLDQNEEEQISVQPTRKEKCDKLFEILPRKGPKAFEVFVEALKKQSPHLASHLIEAGKEEKSDKSGIKVSIKWNKEELTFHPNGIITEYPSYKFYKIKCQFYFQTKSPGNKLVDQRHFRDEFPPNFAIDY